MTAPRKIRFVMERVIYNKWYFEWFFKLFNVIPISSGYSKSSIIAINKALANGEAVALFPEGFITRDGKLGKFFRGYELAAKNTDAVIIPFYIEGILGSITSLYKPPKSRRTKNLIRRVTVCYGEPLPETTPALQLECAVAKLGSEICGE